MEAQLEDIECSTTLNTLKTFKSSILDCAKNIKSNDSTFNIVTLPTVSEKLKDLTSSYVNIMHRIESCQKAFSKIYSKLEDEEKKQTNDFTDLNVYNRMFNKAVEEEYKRLTKDEMPAMSELTKIIGEPLDEEIQVEAPIKQIPKDPITKRDIKVAVRSKTCNHIYDKDGIEEYFRQKEAANKTRVQCPRAGCTNRNMKRSELILDEEINELIQSLYTCRRA